LAFAFVASFSVQTVLWLKDVHFLRVSPLLEGELIQSVTVALAAGLLVGVLKVDRRVLGLTVGPARATAMETLKQLGILAAIALLYMISATVVARTTHHQVAVRPGSLEDASQFWGFLIPAVLIGPLNEEIMARGMLTSALYWPGRKWVTIVASAVIFAGFHFLMIEKPAQYVGLFVVGALLAWSFLRTRSVVTPFVIHAAFNLGVLIKDLVILRNPGFVRRILGYE
jgi:membrane protease YdiL (CAAX protease family)